MALHQAQAIIAKDLHRFRILVCGRKFGKTTLSSEEIKGFAIAKDNQRIMYMAPSLKEARRLMWKRLRDEFGNCIVKDNETRLELDVRTIKGGTSNIVLGSWEIVDSYRGDEFDFIVCDEVQDYKNFWEGWLEALRPTLTPRMGQALFMGTPKGFNHFYDLYNLKDPSYVSYKFTTYDNPHIPREEIEEARRNSTEDKFAQEYLADFRKTEGLVYKEFNREQHLFDDFTPKGQINEILVGVDFGFTNPAAVIRIEKDFDNTYWITDEWYKTGKTNAQITEAVKSFQPNIVYADPASPERIKELEQAGLNCREVIKGHDSVTNGIDKVRELFKANRLRIHKKCVNIITELETYRYSETRPEEPEKENDHSLDAIRYALTMNMPTRSIIDDDFNIYANQSFS